jgi:hypothetical protein
MKPKPVDYLKYPVRICRTVHHCEACDKDIVFGEKYHDGGFGKRAHFLCSQADEAIECIECNGLTTNESVVFLRGFMAEVFEKLAKK